MSAPTADRAEAHLQRRAQVRRHLARLSDLLEAWDAWETDRLLPPAERQLSRPPEGNRGPLEALHPALVTELHDLDAAAQHEPARTRR